MGFNFRKAFGRPVKIINDAAMQALGSYKGGRMLFLGLGTGLGSAMIVDGMLQPMELAHLIYKNGKTYEDYLGLRGLERFGKKKWRQHVAKITKKLKTALEADYVVLGGGNSKKLKKLASRHAARQQRKRLRRRLFACGRNSEASLQHTENPYSDNPGDLKGSTQHWPAVYPPEFEIPRFVVVGY